MDDNKKETDKIFKDLLLEFMIEIWGERCPDYEESCPSCHAWNNYDIMIVKIESTPCVYQHRFKTLESNDIRELDVMSEKGWEVWAAIRIPGEVSKYNTIFYFRKKL